MVYSLLGRYGTVTQKATLKWEKQIECMLRYEMKNGYSQNNTHLQYQNVTMILVYTSEFLQNKDEILFPFAADGTFVRWYEKKFK